MRKRRIAAFAAVISMACAGDPASHYTGPPASEGGAVLEAGADAGVYAIDGRRAFGDSWTLAPGKHVLWVKARVRGRTARSDYTGWSYCQLRLEAEPGATYRTRVRKVEMPGGNDDARVTVDLRLLDASGNTVATPGACSRDRPPLDPSIRAAPLAIVPMGPWGWPEGELACESNPHRIRLSEDERSLDFDYEKPVRGAGGDLVTQVRYRVLDRTERWITLELEGETERDARGRTVRWHLVPLSVEAYCWRRTDWERNRCSRAVRRCAP